MTLAPDVAKTSGNCRKQVAAAAVLAAVTFFAYLPALQANFIWDDNLLLTDYPLMHAPDGLRRFWTTLEAPDYYPLTWSSLWIEWRLWGEDATGYHVTNVVMHVIGALLLWRVLRGLRIPGAWLAAMVFAVHPVTLASVAWISERKNVLSLIFYLLALLLFVRIRESRRPWLFMGLSLLAYMLGLISKTSIVPLPVAAGLCLWWQHTRSPLPPGPDPDRQGLWWRMGAPTSVALGAMFLLSLAGGALTVYTQYHTVIGSMNAYQPGEGGLPWRLALAGWSPWFYLWKLLVPQPLLMIYNRWDINPADVVVYLPGVALVGGVGALAYLTYRGRNWARACLMAALYFLALLSPVLGFGKMYFHVHSLVADHLQYLAMIGPIVLIVGAAVAFAQRRGAWVRRAGIVLAGVVLAALVGKTWVQGHYYMDQEALWTYNLDPSRNPNAWMACYNMGTCIAGRASETSDPQVHKALLERAVGYFQQSLAVRPQYNDTYNNYGLTLMNLGRHGEAEKWFRKGIELDPKGSAYAYRNLAILLKRQKQLDQAEQILRTGIANNPQFVDAKLDLAEVRMERSDLAEAAKLIDEVLAAYPRHVPALLNRGYLHRRQGRPDLAEQDVRQAIAIQDIPDLWLELGVALDEQHHYQEALDQYARVLAVGPGNWMAHYRAGFALANLGRRPEAIQHYANVIGLQPRFPDAYGNLALLLAQQGQFVQAKHAYQQVMTIRPDWAEVMLDYARLLIATDDPSVRDLPMAMNLASRACQLLGDKPFALETLALVQAEGAQFEQAQKTALRAMKLAADAGDMRTVTRIDKLVQLCKAGRTPRQGAGAPVP
jgi:tetratricopeptide (TPR) repeat protein